MNKNDDELPSTTEEINDIDSISDFIFKQLIYLAKISTKRVQRVGEIDCVHIIKISRGKETCQICNWSKCKLCSDWMAPYSHCPCKRKKKLKLNV